MSSVFFKDSDDILVQTKDLIIKIKGNKIAAAQIGENDEVKALSRELPHLDDIFNLPLRGIIKLGHDLVGHEDENPQETSAP